MIGPEWISSGNNKRNHWLLIKTNIVQIIRKVVSHLFKCIQKMILAINRPTTIDKWMKIRYLFCIVFFSSWLDIYSCAVVYHLFLHVFRMQHVWEYENQSVCVERNVKTNDERVFRIFSSRWIKSCLQFSNIRRRNRKLFQKCFLFVYISRLFATKKHCMNKILLEKHFFF